MTSCHWIDLVAQSTMGNNLNALGSWDAGFDGCNWGTADKVTFLREKLPKVRSFAWQTRLSSMYHHWKDAAFPGTSIWTHLDHIPWEGFVPCKWEVYEKQNKQHLCSLPLELGIRGGNVSLLGGEKYYDWSLAGRWWGNTSGGENRYSHWKSEEAQSSPQGALSWCRSSRYQALLWGLRGVSESREGS